MLKKILLVVAIVLIAFRLYLPTLVKDFVNKELNKDPMYHGSIQDVRIHLWRGAYSLDDLKLEEVIGQKDFPFIASSQIDFSLSWRALFHGALVCNILIKDLNVNIVQEPDPKVAAAPTENKGDEKSAPKKVNVGADTKQERKVEGQTWQESIRSLVPLEVTSLKIAGGSIHFRDLTTQPPLDVYLDELDIGASNLNNAARNSERLFGLVYFKARAMKSGKLSGLIYLDPLAIPAEFKATVQVEKLDLKDLNPFFEAYEKFNVKKGNFSMYTEVATANGNIKGYTKPLIEDLQVADFKKDSKRGIMHALWEESVGFVAGILKNFPKDRQAAVIPFSGKIDNPKTSGWEIAKSVLHNMFIEPLQPKVDHTIHLKDVQKPEKRG